MTNQASGSCLTGGIGRCCRVASIIVLAMVTGLPASLAVSQEGPGTEFAFSEREFENAEQSPFTASGKNPEFVYPNGDRASLRAWIGYSDCRTCKREDVYSQGFRFDNLRENEPIEIVLNFGVVAGESTFKASIAEGSGEFLEGASFAVKPELRSRDWTIRLRATSSTLRLRITNQLMDSPSAYAYLDKILIARGTRLPFSLRYQPRYTGRVIEHEGRLLPLYRSSPSSAGTQAVAFEHRGDYLRAINQNGFLLWEIPVQTESLFRGNGIVGEPYRNPLIGGFDYNDDGWPDLALVRRTGRTDTCGAYHANQTYLELVDGRTGSLMPVTVPTPSNCHHFGETVYPTAQWFAQSIRGNQDGGVISLAQQYSRTGEFLVREGGRAEQRHLFIHPSTGAYEFYPNARHLPGPTVSKHVHNSQFPNGLLVNVRGEERYVFFTSRRIVQYRVTGLAQDQLIADHPFLIGGRFDLAGRSYGRVSLDRSAEGRVIVLAGADVSELVSLMSGDEAITSYLRYGGIERHLTIYHYLEDRIDHRFFSTIHDPEPYSGGFEGRVVAPLNFLLATRPDEPSRIAFNLYSSGKWALHITGPGSSKDDRVIADRILWDIRDLDDDGSPELILSPAGHCSEEAAREAYCLPAWSTIIARWNEAEQTLEAVEEIPGKLPALIPAFNEPASATVYSPYVTGQDMDGRLLLKDNAGNISGLALR